jgi:hypothetical protein
VPPAWPSPRRPSDGVITPEKTAPHDETDPVHVDRSADGRLSRLAARVEADTVTPVTGVVFSFTVTHQWYLQLIVRPGADQDFKLPGVPRADGTYDTFAPHEAVLAPYDTLGFAATDVGIRLWLCEGRCAVTGV